MLGYLRRMRLDNGLAMAAAALALSACAASQPVRTYDGAPRPQESVAILRHQSATGPSVYFVRIDHTSLQTGGDLFRPHQFMDLELLPGRHEVEFGWDGPFDKSGSSIVLAFDAQADHTYEARTSSAAGFFPLARLVVTKGHWAGEIVDLQTNEVVAGGVSP
jgi:hypothetical protein